MFRGMADWIPQTSSFFGPFGECQFVFQERVRRPKGLVLRHARLDSIDNNSARSQLRRWRAIVSSWPQEATVVLWGRSGVIGAAPQTLRLFGPEVVDVCAHMSVGKPGKVVA